MYHENSETDARNNISVSLRLGLGVTLQRSCSWSYIAAELQLELHRSGAAVGVTSQRSCSWSYIAAELQLELKKTKTGLPFGQPRFTIKIMFLTQVRFK